MSDLLLKLEQIEKSYPGVKPLDRVDFDVRPGEVHALLGENGAGKSTLTRVIGGATIADAGRIEYLGRPVTWRDPHQARDAGIHVIHQELALFPELTVTENILVDHQPRGRFGLISHKKAVARATEILTSLGVSIDPEARIDELALADQQMVEIAKALLGKTRLLILDEPTAVISGREVELLFERIRHLKTEGLGIVYISHRLEEIFEIADRVTILKDGEVVGTSDVADMTRDTMITMMVGRQLEQIFPPKREEPANGPIVLQIDHLKSSPRVNDVSLQVRAGEIVCIAGMVGSGRTEVAEAVFGMAPIENGKISIDGKTFLAMKPSDAIRQGLGFLTENRKEEGLFLELSIAANIVAPSLKAISKNGLIDRRAEKEISDHQVAAFSVATPSSSVKVGALSGGNQQKVLFSRWSRIANRLLILDEPTRGVDVGAKVEIYRLVRELADSGIAVLMISSELPEVVGLSDRVVVMANGYVAGEVTGAELSEENIMHYAVTTVEASTAHEVQT